MAALQKQFTYERHKPEETLLYKIVQENLLTFLEQVEMETGYSLPNFVIKEFEEYLKCGILAHGFLRAKCESCSNEHLVAFSCKRRGFCPSCGVRRMNESAIHMVDEVLPNQAIRQWVLSFPFQLRLVLAIRPKIMGKCLAIATKCISNHLIKKAGLKNAKAKTGAVTLIQRFGGSVNLNVHFHQMTIDGAYELDENNEPKTFHPTSAPTIPELESVLAAIIEKITKYLEKSGIIIKDDENKEFQLEIPQEDSLSRLQAAAVTYKFAMGANKGKKALVLKTIPETDHNSRKGLVATSSGFSLHAGVHVAAGKKKELEKICRYIARPPIAEERLSQNASGQIVYKLKRPYDDGTSHIVMSPMELMEKLASIVPRPKVHLTRFHGALAPHYKFRKMIVPVKAEPPKLELVPDQTPMGKLAEQKKKTRISWARLLKRIFGIDIEKCNLCGGKVKIISAIEDPRVIKKILDHVGMPSVAPAPKPARGPPQNETNQDEFDFHQQSPEEF
jgi:hypothetical protein